MCRACRVRSLGSLTRLFFSQFPGRKAVAWVTGIEGSEIGDLTKTTRSLRWYVHGAQLNQLRSKGL